jgi:hypothetical protein
MQLAEQEPLRGRFGYSDLKEATLRGGLCIFYRSAAGGGTGAADRVGRLQPWTMQKWVVLKQLRMVVGIVCWLQGLDKTQGRCACRSTWTDRGWSWRLMRHING